MGQKIEDKAHLSPAEAEGGAELGNKNLDTKIPSFGNELEYPISNLKLTWVISSEKSGKFNKIRARIFFFHSAPPSGKILYYPKINSCIRSHS